MASAEASWDLRAGNDAVSRTEDVAIKPQPVAVRDLVGFHLTEAGALQSVGDLGQVAHMREPVRRRHLARPRCGPGAVVHTARPAALAHPVAVAVGEALAPVGANGDVIDAGDLDGPLDHVAPVVDGAAIV